MKLFPRVAAAIVVSVLLIITSTITIIITQNIGAAITYSTGVIHKHGTVIGKVDATKSLTFKTDNGEILHLICTQRCLTEFGHMERHINEKAPTDLYYKEEGNQDIAVNVD